MENRGFPGGSDGKESACNEGDPSSTPGLRRSLGVGNGHLLQYSCLENSMDGEAWWLQSMGSQRVKHDWETNAFTLFTRRTDLWLPRWRTGQGRMDWEFEVQFSSVQLLSRGQLCVSMNRSTPGLPIHHQLPEFTHTHIHRVGDAIQPSHPLSSPSPLAPNPSQHQSLFQWVNSSHEVAKVLEFQLQHHSFQWMMEGPRTDLLQIGLVGSPCSPRDSQESSPTPQFKSINSLVLSFIHSPTLTFIRDHWKNHSLD